LKSDPLFKINSKNPQEQCLADVNVRNKEHEESHKLYDAVGRRAEESNEKTRVEFLAASGANVLSYNIKLQVPRVNKSRNTENPPGSPTNSPLYE